MGIIALFRTDQQLVPIGDLLIRILLRSRPHGPLTPPRPYWQAAKLIGDNESCLYRVITIDSPQTPQHPECWMRSVFPRVW